MVRILNSGHSMKLLSLACAAFSVPSSYIYAAKLLHNKPFAVQGNSRWRQRTHFHKKGFALRLALKQRHKGTRKWLHRPLSRSGQLESQENKRLCFCPSSLALDERLDRQNLLFWLVFVRFRLLEMVLWFFPCDCYLFICRRRSLGQVQPTFCSRTPFLSGAAIKRALNSLLVGHCFVYNI